MFYGIFPQEYLFVLFLFLFLKRTRFGHMEYWLAGILLDVVIIVLLFIYNFYSTTLCSTITLMTLHNKEALSIPKIDKEFTLSFADYSPTSSSFSISFTESTSSARSLTVIPKVPYSSLGSLCIYSLGDLNTHMALTSILSSSPGLLSELHTLIANTLVDIEGSPE